MNEDTLSNSIAGFTPARGTSFIQLMKVDNPTPQPPPPPAPAKRSIAELQAKYDLVKAQEEALRDQRTAVSTAIGEATAEHRLLEVETIPALQLVWETALITEGEARAHADLLAAKARHSDLRDRVIALQKREKALPKESSLFQPPEAAALKELLHRASEISLETLDLSAALAGLHEVFVLRGSNMDPRGWPAFLAEALPLKLDSTAKQAVWEAALARHKVSL